MKNRLQWLPIAGALIAGLVGGVIGSSLPGLKDAGIRAYLLAHPEIIPEAMRRLQDGDTAKRIAADREAIETPFAGAWAGNPKGDVTLVMFTDYACGYCRQAAPEIDALLAKDKRLKVVWRELPVLGSDSVAAARAALMVAKAGSYPVFHRAMFAGGRPDAAGVDAAIARAGLPDARQAPTEDVDREIESNLALAGRLGISGTPSFVVGDQLLTGAVGLETLRRSITTTRGKRSL